MNFLDGFFEMIDYFDGVEDDSKKSKSKKQPPKQNSTLNMLDDLGIGFINIFSITDDFDEPE